MTHTYTFTYYDKCIEQYYLSYRLIDEKSGFTEDKDLLYKLRLENY